MLKLFIIATVFVTGTFAEEAAGTAGAAGIPLSAFDKYEYKLTVADDEDYEKVLKAAGLDEADITELKKITTGATLIFDSPDKAGEEYTMEWKSGDASIYTAKFTLNEEKPFTTGEKSATKKFTVGDADTLVDESKIGENTLTVTWKFTNEKVTCEMKVGEVKCDRVYEKSAAAAAAPAA